MVYIYSSSYSSSSAMRMSGLASGIDTDSIIEQLMAAHRAPVNRLEQQRTWTEWQRDAYREVNTLITNFRNYLFDFKLEGNLRARTATVTGASDAVSVRATGSAYTGTLNVEVKQLATAASLKSTTIFKEISAFDPNTKLSEVFAAKKNEDSNFNYQETYLFKINGTEIEVNIAEDSLNDVIKRINEKTNVTAFYHNGEISFVSKQTGAINGPDGKKPDIVFEDVDGDFLESIFKVNNPDSKISAQNAIITVNGIEVRDPSNTINVNGVEITLHQVTPEGQSATIQVSTDADQLVEKIKGFIEEYNKLIATLNEKVRETRYRDYPPLTKAQKEEMEEREIELWEEKAKSGLLRNDSLIMQALSDMRMDMSAQVKVGDNQYMTLSSIGIETGSYNEHGKLYLSDEAALREAIAKDPDAVIALFTANGEENGDGSDVGIAERIYASLLTTVDNLTEKAGRTVSLADNSILGKQLKQIDEEIAAWNERLFELENRYYRQFTAMEMAISRYNSQSAYLMSMFSSN